MKDKLIPALKALAILLLLSLGQSAAGQTNYEFRVAGNWEDASNWVHEVIPPAQAGDAQIRIKSDCTISSATITLNGGRLEIRENVTLTINGGTLNLNNGARIEGGGRLNVVSGEANLSNSNLPIRSGTTIKL